MPGGPRWEHRRRSKSKLTQMYFLFLQPCVRGVSGTRLRRECIYMRLTACTLLLSLYFSVCM